MAKSDVSVIFFTALHQCRAVLAMSEMSVCPAVCLSIKRVNCDKRKNLSPHSYTTRRIDASSFAI